MANVTYYPPDAIGWHCNICDTPVDVWQQLDHIASPQHRARAGRHPLGASADELTGHWIVSTGGAQDRRSGGGVRLGVTDGGGERKWRQPMVEDGGEEYEDAEDYEETDSEEEEEEEEEEEREGEYDEGEDDEEDDYAEEEEVVDGRILWTCDICTITINIFARDDHLRSRQHFRAARPETYEPPPPSAQPTFPITWRCTLCDEEMTVFHQTDHLASKQHLKMARKQHTGTENPNTETAAPPSTFYSPINLEGDAATVLYPISPEAARSTAYQFRNTFYCITCADEFDRSMLEQHLDTTSTWDCALCAMTMHPAARDQHFGSEAHVKLCEAENRHFFCNVCQQSFELASKANHLAGTAHRTIAAKQRFEQMLREQRNAAQPLVNPPAATVPRATANTETPRTTAAQQRTDPWSCHLCGEYLYAELLSSHLAWNCTVAPGSRACKVAPARPPTSSKTATPKQKKSKKKKKAPPEGSLYCSICKKYKMAIGMEDHMNGKKHKNKAAAKKKNKAPTVNAENPQPAPKVQPAKPPPAPPVHAATPVVAPAYTTITGDSFYCSVCARTRMTAGIADHVRSKKHKKNVVAARGKQPATPGGTA